MLLAIDIQKLGQLKDASHGGYLATPLAAFDSDDDDDAATAAPAAFDGPGFGSAEESDVAAAAAAGGAGRVDNGGCPDDATCMPEAIAVVLGAAQPLL